MRRDGHAHEAATFDEAPGSWRGAVTSPKQRSTRVSGKVETRRIGRPPKADSVLRRAAIVAAARRRFAVHGYASTTLSVVVKDVGISLAALYHYFEDKRELYEAVFDDSIEAAWTATRHRVEAAREREPGLIGLLHAIDETGMDLDTRNERATNMFLTTVPIEAARHQELAHLLDKRASVQDREIRAIVAPAFEAGELPCFDDLPTAIDGIRVVIMGWSLETFLTRGHMPPGYAGIGAILRHLARPAAPPVSGKQSGSAKGGGKRRSARATSA